ncbi:hypothetical protein [Pontibacillus halophilus]|nr:hypothetical protein [Pontibacillus halophilus]
MAGSMKWNLWSATGLGLLAFGLAIQSNTMPTTFIRTGIIFTLVYIVVFGFRWLVKQAIIEGPPSLKNVDEAHETNKTTDVKDDPMQNVSIEETSEMVKQLLREDDN